MFVLDLGFLREIKKIVVHFHINQIILQFKLKMSVK